MTSMAITRIAGVLLSAALLLAACSRTGDVNPADNPTPTPARTEAPGPEPPTFDEDAAADLFIRWREIVYALPPTQPEAVDVELAAEEIVAPDSDASEWVAQELRLARDRGVIVRGSVHAETLSAPQVTGNRATADICSSADLRVTDVATGDPVSDDATDTSYTPFDAAYRRIGDSWLVESADRNDEQNCVPPSIDRALTDGWELFTEAWYERDRQGGGQELGQLAEVVTDRFAETLRGLPPRDPVPDPTAFTDYDTTAVTRTTATGQACRFDALQTVEWVLADGQWRIDFAGRVGQEPAPCP